MIGGLLVIGFLASVGFGYLVQPGIAAWCRELWSRPAPSTQAAVRDASAQIIERRAREVWEEAQRHHVTRSSGPYAITYESGMSYRSGRIAS